MEKLKYALVKAGKSGGRELFSSLLIHPVSLDPSGLRATKGSFLNGMASRAMH